MKQRRSIRQRKEMKEIQMLSGSNNWMKDSHLLMNRTNGLMNYTNALCYDYLTQDRFYKTEDTPTKESETMQTLIDFNNSDGKITTACQARKYNITDELHRNSNKPERLNRNSEKLVTRMCSEPQTGELARESEKQKNLDSSLCPLAHANETENMSSIRESPLIWIKQRKIRMFLATRAIIWELQRNRSSLASARLS